VKSEIHPEIRETIIRCACGAEFTTKSTEEELRVEICSNCHPFYTGRQQRARTGGRIEKFREKYGYMEGEESDSDEDDDKSADE